MNLISVLADYFGLRSWKYFMNTLLRGKYLAHLNIGAGEQIAIAEALYPRYKASKASQRQARPDFTQFMEYVRKMGQIQPQKAADVETTVSGSGAQLP